MRRLSTALFLTLAFHTTAHADRKADADDRASARDQVVVVNASGGDSGQVARIHRVLDQRGMLFPLSEGLEATLEGRSTMLADLESIKNAYASGDFEAALKIIIDDEKHLLGRGGADVGTQLSLLAGWRGLIAGAMDKDEEALRQFRAAVRMNPAWALDKKLPSPRVRSIIVKAKREVDETGTLKALVDPTDATVAVDGNETKLQHNKTTLPVGLHLVQISAEARKTHAEIVEIDATKPYKIDIALEPEGELDKAIKLVDETAAARSGAPRLDHARGISKLTGGDRLLVIEGIEDTQVRVRLYDTSLKKVSKSLTIDGNASSAAIASELKSALDPDNTVDVNTVVIGGNGEPLHEEAHWYNHWYVWVGAAALLGGTYASYSYATREPTSLRGF